ncbi:MAG: hypothetical protein CW345_09670 [Firmicutes bacterium]|nr:hypothetical protein [Bacillota bacterium]MBO2522044.1 hypothetical protein [Bacillota bacterium]
MASKVAIVGGAWTRRLAPYGDDAWEIWAFSSLKLHTPRITRWFEMHALPDLKGQLVKETRRRHSYASYMAFLRRLEVPVYMQDVVPEVPGSVRYPLEQALAAFGRCFSSTASYLIALAILEGFPTIGVWGVHLTHKSVYARQRPGVEYLLGVARQRGIEVVLPRQSPLKIPKRPVLPRVDVLYGYDWQSPKAWWRRRPRRRRSTRR